MGGIQPSCQQSMTHPYCISTNKCLKTYANVQNPFSTDFLIALCGVGRFTIVTQQCQSSAATPPLPAPIIPEQFSNPKPTVKSYMMLKFISQSFVIIYTNIYTYIYIYIIIYIYIYCAIKTSHLDRYPRWCAPAWPSRY